MALYIFPQFKALSIEDKDEINSLLQNFPPYSDFNFSSMWAWNISKTYQASLLNNNLVVKFSDYNTDQPFYSFIGNNKAIDTVKQLINLAKKEGIEQTLKLLPQDNFSNEDIEILKRNFSIVKDRDNFDYILSVKGMAEMTESTYQKKRNLITKFTNMFADTIPVILDYRQEKIRNDIVQLFYRWEKQRKKTRDETQNELEALQRILHTKEISEVVVGIYCEDKLISFSLSDITNDSYGVTHFEKSDADFYGVSTYIKHVAAKELWRRGCTKINYEQDFGYEGLRKAKELLHPIGFLEKYTISPLTR